MRTTAIKYKTAHGTRTEPTMTRSTFDEIIIEFGNVKNYLASMIHEPVLFIEVNHYERGARTALVKKAEQADLFTA